MIDMKYINIEYLYYLYSSKKTSAKDISNTFNYGIISNNGPDLDSTMIKVGTDPSIIKDVIKENKCKCAYVIRIPKMFLQPKIENGNLKQIPIPIWQLDSDGSYILKSNLIHGAYNAKIKQYFSNRFYNEVYCPNGLHFDMIQADYFVKNNITKWISFYDYRRCRNFLELNRIDRKKTIWRPVVTQYTAFYNHEMVKKLNTSIIM